MNLFAGILHFLLSLFLTYNSAVFCQRYQHLNTEIVPNLSSLDWKRVFALEVFCRVISECQKVMTLSIEKGISSNIEVSSRKS